MFRVCENKDRSKDRMVVPFTFLFFIFAATLQGKAVFEILQRLSMLGCVQSRKTRVPTMGKAVVRTGPFQLQELCRGKRLLSYFHFPLCSGIVRQAESRSRENRGKSKKTMI